MPEGLATLTTKAVDWFEMVLILFFFELLNELNIRSFSFLMLVINLKEYDYVI